MAVITEIYLTLSNHILHVKVNGHETVFFRLFRYVLELNRFDRVYRLKRNRM